MVSRGPSLVFLDSWPPDPSVGSGTAVAIAGLQTAVEDLGVPVRRIAPPWRRGPLLLARLGYNLSLSRRLHLRPDEVPIGFDVDGSLLPRRLANRLVVSLKGIAAEEKRFERSLAHLGLASLAFFEGRSCRRARLVVVTSEHSRREAIRVYGLVEARIEVVPEGIDLERWPVIDRPPPTGELRLLTVGRQYPRKNTKTLIEAMPYLERLGVAASLTVVGGGPELPRLRALALSLGLTDRVRFAGEVSFESLQDHYREADLFCLLSRQEGFGIVLLEAMASVLPVVAARAGAIPEVVVDGDTALLVPAEDARAAAEAIARLAADPALARRLGGAGRARAEAFDWPLVAERFITAIREAAVDRGALDH